MTIDYNDSNDYLYITVYYNVQCRTSLYIIQSLTHSAGYTHTHTHTHTLHDIEH